MITTAADGEDAFDVGRFLIRTARLRELADGADDLVWLVIGDSVAAGSVHTVGGRNYGELIAERTRFELGRTGHLVINTAVPGWSTAQTNADLRARALRFTPGVTLIGLGFNDCRLGLGGLEAFGVEYEALLDRLVDAGSLPVVQVPNAALPTVSDPVLDVLPVFRDAMLAIAAARDLPVVDHFGLWQAVGQLTFHDWIGHGCHPNAYGHRMMARTILAAVGWDDPRSSTVQLTVPGAPRVLAPGEWVLTPRR